MARRIGLTMRVDHAVEGAERRDVLAGDWASTLAHALGEIPWVPVPNLGAGVRHFLKQWDIGAVILTGGNDVGSCPLRDETETTILDVCLQRGLPVLGVCRGLQLLQAYFGGRLRPTPETHWAGRRHAVVVCHERGRQILGRERIEVPSFHRHGVRLDELCREFETWAVSEDGFVEGAFHRDAPVTAVQWHPERPLPDPEIALRLLRGFYRE